MVCPGAAAMVGAATGVVQGKTRRLLFLASAAAAAAAAPPSGTAYEFT